MQKSELGRSGIQVSRLCLGTMTFGRQNTEADAFRQLDMALDAGIDFVDTAEMYAFPADPRTQGLTETYIGNWMKARGARNRVTVATKITGPGDRFEHIRGGTLRYTADQIAAAIDGSLTRLGTDVIDLYQLHWPERQANYFGRLDYRHARNQSWTPLEVTLEALGREVERGRIRAVGVSNETPWGLMKFLALSAQMNLPRVAAIQNPYSLLCRTFEIGLSEIAIREQCGLLAYSPLSFGALTGKYLNGARPAGTRLALFPAFGRYVKPLAQTATAEYVAIAKKFGLDPAQMAIAFVASRPFVTSAIIGATTDAQLAANIAAAGLTLAPEVVEAIDAVHASNPNPAP